MLTVKHDIIVKIFPLIPDLDVSTFEEGGVLSLLFLCYIFLKFLLQPDMHDEVDPAVLAALAPSLQHKLIQVGS